MEYLRTLKILFKLLPPAMALRRDRKEWASDTGAKTGRYRRNAQKALDAFVSLGPVYIKLGQWLSSRADILPQPYLEELSKLQDAVPVVSFEKIKPIVEKKFGSLDAAFEEFEQEALSGASLGQVYRARLAGQDVIVKVKRPGIEKTIRRDLAILKRILPLGLRLIDPNLRFSAEAMLSQFIDTINEELDYTAELANLKKIRNNMDNSAVIIPRAYEEHSSREILVMEYVPGIKITDITELDRQGIDRTRLVIDVHKVFFTMLLRYSIFHADPHPGNISVTDTGRLILYDYGMVGRLDDESRRRLVRLYLALVEKNPSRTVNAMNELGMLAPDHNRAVIEQAIGLTVQALHGRKPSEMEVNSLLEIANKTMSRFPFILPKHLALYMRMASIIEGIYKSHDVDFKFVNVLREILEEEHLVKDAYVEELKYTLGNFAKSIDAAISIAPELKRYLEDNRSLQLQNAGRHKFGLLSGSILASAVFVGSVLLYQYEPAVAMGGIACAAVIMAVSVLKKG